MSLSSSERKEAGLLHGLSSRTSAGSAHASSSTAASQQGDPWKKNPTLIPTPGSQRTSGKNPWAGTPASTLSKTPSKYNRTANATMTKAESSNTYARKKIKTDHPSRWTEPNTTKTSSANAILAPQEDGEPIDIDDAYGPSTDDLNIGHDQPYSPLKLQLPQPNGYPSKPRENVTVAPDGAATSRLKRSLELINVDSDPIEQFESSDFVPSSNHVSVKERVAHIDQGGITPLTAERRVDFRTLPIKARMKKKDPQPSTAQYDIVTASSTGLRIKPDVITSKIELSRSLPLSFCTLGCYLIDCGHPTRVEWDRNSDKLSIMQGKRAELMMFHIQEDFSSVEYTEPSAKNTAMLVINTSKLPENRRTPLIYEGHFDQGSGTETGNVCLEINTGDSKFSLVDLKDLIAWIGQKIDDKKAIRLKEAHAQREIAERLATNLGKPSTVKLSRSLPLSFCTLGCYLIDCGHSTRVEWDRNSDKLSIMQGKRTEWMSFRVQEDFSSVEYTEPSVETNAILVITTLMPLKNKRTPLIYHDRFNRGSGTETGNICLEITAGDPDFALVALKDLISWIRQKVDDRKIIHFQGAFAKRKMAEHLASNWGEQNLNLKGLPRNNAPRTAQKFATNQVVPSSLPTKRHASEEVETLDESTPAPPISESEKGSPTPVEPNMENLPPRLSKDRKRLLRSSNTKKPQVDPDEVILVYPQGKPGAVNINNADLSRLEPGEFLNDNLIEFGLKLWLQDLEEKNPNLANDIHVFSSFFYKKLNKKNVAEGYDSVRKWTSKFDLFAKKYVIVPINENLHWYLAIIYHPEHVLLPPILPAIPPTRHQTRLSDAISRKVIEPGNLTSGTSTRESSPAEVERDLKNFYTSCTVDDIEPCQKPSLSPVEAESDKLNHFSRPRSRSPYDMDVDHEMSENSRSRSIPSIDLPGISQEDHEGEAFRSNRIVDQNIRNAAIQSFYAPLSKKARGKQKAIELPAMDVDDQGDAEGEGEDVITSRPQTYIFTLDSLGSRHPQAVQQLRKYLTLEAKNKKGSGETSAAIGKTASVPVQPNYCDCGIYLLHLAQTFMTNPEGYCARILAPRGKKAIPNAERQADWNDAKVAGMRGELAEKIKDLSVAWKKDRDTKEEAKKREATEAGPQNEVSESSDDEIDIVASTVPALKSKGKTKATTPKQTKANRIRG